MINASALAIDNTSSAALVSEMRQTRAARTRALLAAADPNHLGLSPAFAQACGRRRGRLGIARKRDIPPSVAPGLEPSISSFA